MLSRGLAHARAKIGKNEEMLIEGRCGNNPIDEEVWGERVKHTPQANSFTRPRLAWPAACAPTTVLTG
ncbi:unnamed protein product [Citrullus colocynthis]|uniref:Uncharacterized protein n=1 Tax=Citrullus colocynthis TaxID=252529 RepID=A0ABP0YUC4_9ROSI